MTELTIRPEEIRDALDSYVRSYEPGAASREEVGRVIDAGDGIAHVEGLPSAMTNELLQFEDGTLGIALNLDVHEIGVVILGEFSGIEEGQEVKRTGEVLSVPVGDKFLGRVVNPLGDPIDGLGEIVAEERRALELQAPSVIERKSVHEPLQTGIKAIDSMIPIGRGQRQLIIGDRQTGKTTVAVDTIINQKADWESGDPTSRSAASTSPSARRARPSPPCVASSRRPARWSTRRSSPLRPLTPPASSTSRPTPARPSASTGCTTASTSSSSSTTCPSRPRPTAPCRCCCVVRRAARPTPATSSTCTAVCSSVAPSSPTTWAHGSMTGLPIIETKAGDVSAYIPTNVISITDGQIYLQSDLFNANVRPAIDVGVSVSRVGGAAQIKAMKGVAGRLKLDLAQFRAMEAFAMFASDLDPASRAQLAKGARLVELLKQQQASPYAGRGAGRVIWAGTTGKLDDIAVEDIRRSRREFLDYLRRDEERSARGHPRVQEVRRGHRAGPRGESTLSSTSSSWPAARRRPGRPRAGGRAPRRGTRVEQDQIVKQKR